MVEGAGAAALAAILSHPERFAGRKVGVPLTGGNIDPRMLASVIMRDPVRSDHLMRLDVPISDRPGALAELAAVLAAEGANIVDISHERLSLALNPKSAALDIVIELQEVSHGEAAITALQAQGFDGGGSTVFRQEHQSGRYRSKAGSEVWDTTVIHAGVRIWFFFSTTFRETTIWSSSAARGDVMLGL